MGEDSRVRGEGCEEDDGRGGVLYHGGVSRVKVRIARCGAAWQDAPSSRNQLERGGGGSPGFRRKDREPDWGGSDAFFTLPRSWLLSVPRFIVNTNHTSCERSEYKWRSRCDSSAS